ncbi:MAG: tRNA 2-thiouridine(34) synthase MnmA [Candidatus Staskawiczbacteria bacterium]|jgi:tRNA-specific 2-thiouridylase
MVRVACAMSGGVDSSVSAALLKKAGFNVVGIYMRQWSPEILEKECIWKADRQDAMRACAKLGIPFLTWDFSKEYETEVGKYMIDSYKKGITPNPDVMCNKIIKFGYFFDKAMKQGFDFVATGHYAQTSLGNKLFLRGEPLYGAPSSRKSSLPRLLKAVDANKDQTYFLYTLKQKQLNKILFPVGNLEKPEVRKLAKKFKLENAEKKDSQGVCFVGQFDMKNFLKMYIKPKIGEIISIDGKKIGKHDGVYYYTIGQRHGLDIKNGHGPYFVVKKDIKKNIIYVGTEKDLAVKEAKIINISWINKPEIFPVLMDVRTRYRAPLQKAILYKDGKLVFKKLGKALAQGQSAVFYKGSQVLGGGIIK